MLNYLWDIGGQVIRLTGQLDRQYWVLVFCAVLVAGFFLTRGFSSRLS